jgi:hypothetical protein
MFLYQLAWEFEEEPPALAARAVALGLGSIDPSDELTAEQEATLRATFHGTPGAGGRSTPEASMPYTTPTGPQGHPEEPAPKRVSDGRGKKMLGIAAGVVAFAGVIAFFMSQTSQADERRSERSDELAEWDAAPPATIAAEQKEAAAFPSDQPRDLAAYCAAVSTMREQETNSPEVEENEQDWTEFRKWAADREAWRTAMDEMIHTGPLDGVPDITDYRDLREYYYRVLAEASDPQLRALAQNTELDELEGYKKRVERARYDMKPYVNRFCGEPTG